MVNGKILLPFQLTKAGNLSGKDRQECLSYLKFGAHVAGPADNRESRHADRDGPLLDLDVAAKCHVCLF